MIQRPPTPFGVPPVRSHTAPVGRGSGSVPGVARAGDPRTLLRCRTGPGRDLEAAREYALVP